jgi:hypothetical protein
MSNYDYCLSSTRYPRLDKQRLPHRDLKKKKLRAAHRRRSAPASDGCRMPRPKGNRRIKYVPVIVRGLAAGLLSIYAIILAQITLRPAAAEIDNFHHLQSIASTLSGGRLDWTETEVLGNIALFVPAGFLLAVLLGRTWASVVLCVAVSAAIELAQQRYLPSRVPSLEDVQHNSIGGAIGALTAWPLLRWVRSKAKASIRQAHITFLTEDRESWSRPRQTISEPPRVTP